MQRSDDDKREMLAAIDSAKGLELDLGLHVPFYCFVCVDLLESMDGTVVNTQKIIATVRPKKNASAGCELLATMSFDYSVGGFEEMLVWVDRQKTRSLCSNSEHQWCKLALQDYHLCAVCCVKEAFLGNAASSHCGTDAAEDWQFARE